MKKVKITIISFALALSLTGCGSTEISTESTVSSQVALPQTSSKAESGVQMVNPFITCETFVEAAEKAGFDFILPQPILTDYKQEAIRVIPSEMIEAIYTNGDEDISFRKAVGLEDISGNYNTYETEKAIEIGGVEGTVKSTSEGAMLAVWTDDTHSYSLSTTKALDEEIINPLIENIIKENSARD